MVVFNKIEALDEKEMAKKDEAVEKARRLKVVSVSALAKPGRLDCIREVSQ